MKVTIKNLRRMISEQLSQAKLDVAAPARSLDTPPVAFGYDIDDDLDNEWEIDGIDMRFAPPPDTGDELAS